MIQQFKYDETSKVWKVYNADLICCRYGIWLVKCFINLGDSI